MSKNKNSGGKNTNINGIKYENDTDLNTEYKIINEYKHYKIIQFNINLQDETKMPSNFVLVKQNNLFKYMKNNMNNLVEKGHGCKNPDECYINELYKKIFIIEKKFQNKAGSVCEKIQTPDFKIWQYSRTFPLYKIYYIYCLSNWYKNNCKAELEYLKYKKINYFISDNKTYKNKIVKYILNNTK